jgi:hypothetical protein
MRRAFWRAALTENALSTQFWRGVRVVEGARLESVYTRKGIAGSNPALSASCLLKSPFLP